MFWGQEELGSRGKGVILAERLCGGKEKGMSWARQLPGDLGSQDAMNQAGLHSLT
jgi:hypothetical protein